MRRIVIVCCHDCVMSSVFVQECAFLIVVLKSNICRNTSTSDDLQSREIHVAHY